MAYELHRLLGVSEDTDVNQLRRAYEEQMSAAARSHDHRRALALSSALDDLPDSLRSALYPRLTTRTAYAPPVVATRSPMGRVTRRRGSRPPRIARKARSPRGALRVVLTLVGVIAIVLGIAYWQQHRLNSQSDAGLPPFPDRDRPTSRFAPPPDVAIRDARRDVRRVVNTIRHCLEQGGVLPAPTLPTGGRADFSCGGRTFSLLLQPEDTVSYVRIDAHAYRVVVTTAAGTSASYDSQTDRYSS